MFLLDGQSDLSGQRYVPKPPDGLQRVKEQSNRQAQTEYGPLCGHQEGDSINEHAVLRRRDQRDALEEQEKRTTPTAVDTGRKDK